VTFSGVDQTPRQRLASTGYAYMASGLVAGTEVSGAVAAGAAVAGTNLASSARSYGAFGAGGSTRDSSPPDAIVDLVATVSMLDEFLTDRRLAHVLPMDPRGMPT
jgi:hypothetical protein